MKTLIFLTFTLLLLGLNPLPLGAMPFFTWRGEKGYQVEIYLASPEENQWERFVFTGPQGERLAEYPRSLTNPYFQFHLSPKTDRLWGDLDVGGEKPGEYFLKGRVGGALDLVKILEPEREVVVDRGRALRRVGE